MNVLALLSQPAWQGVGAVVGVSALVVYVWIEVRRHKRRDEKDVDGTGLPAHQGSGPGWPDVPRVEQPRVTYFAVVDPESERRFYSHLLKCIRNANETVYRTGRGFQDERRANVFVELLRAEAEILGRGVDVIRIQTGSRVAQTWADGYAALVRQFPEKLKVLIDFDNVLLGDIGVIDPHGPEPTVYLLYESHQPALYGNATRPAVAYFIENAGWLARTLASNFLQHARTLSTLEPQDVSDLGKQYLYFGWGVHMLSRKMVRDVPDAERLGSAILRGWRRDIVAMMAGPADRATIRRTDDEGDSFDGVAYRLSWWGKTKLDRLEGRAYEPVPVVIEIGGKKVDAFTYVPLPSAKPRGPWSRDSWIDMVVEGAHENQMQRLLAELRAAGVPTDRVDIL